MPDPAAQTSRRSLPAPKVLAALLGVFVFAASTGFGRTVRGFEPLGPEADRLMTALGLSINEISITGLGQVRDADVLATLGEAATGSLFRLDVRRARQQLEALPWVDTATVTRIFPDKLKIDLLQRRPAALCMDGAKASLIDRTGRNLGLVANPELVPGLLRLSGQGAPQAAAELLDLLTAHGWAGRVAVAERKGDRRWTLFLAHGSSIQLPETGAADALAKAITLHKQTGLLDRPGVVLDLRSLERVRISGRPAPRLVAAVVTSPCPIDPSGA